ncbi:hypothetical protein WJX79_007294 [Trebouxia sp. C0005]
MALLASGTQSAAVNCRTSRGTSEVLGITRLLRRNAPGRSFRPPSRKLSVIQKAMAKQDAEGSEQGKPPAEPHFEYKAGDMLGNKYRVTEVLGRGKAGVTYKAERPGGGAVAVKALSLRTMADWKQLELFEKEADALRSLSHPGIPAYKDYFEVDSDGDRAYFLVQELIEGKSLAQMVEAGWQPAQTEVERIAGELLTTFSYLQQQQVVHRDVKPENIILEGGKPGGKLFLVDFGGIQQGSSNVADSEVMDTGTLVGTYGYMAPEQLRGSARPASDLFALGGTLLYLLSGEPPSAFPQRRLKVDFSRVEMSPRLSGLLEGLLQPAHEDRLTATQAKAVLAGQGPAKQQRQQQKAWNPFSQDGWEEARQGSRTSSSDRQAAGRGQQLQPCNYGSKRDCSTLSPKVRLQRPFRPASLQLHTARRTAPRLALGNNTSSDPLRPNRTTQSGQANPQAAAGRGCALKPAAYSEDIDAIEGFFDAASATTAHKPHTPVTRAASDGQKGDHYHYLRLLSPSSAEGGTTVRQARHRDGSLVAIKGLTVQATSSWGQLEMLEQEAAMLRSMSHPGIPSCLSTFQCDVDGSEGFFIVQAC